jgi:hypothetical protein
MAAAMGITEAEAWSKLNKQDEDTFVETMTKSAMDNSLVTTKNLPAFRAEMRQLWKDEHGAPKPAASGGSLTREQLLEKYNQKR